MASNDTPRKRTRSDDDFHDQLRSSSGTPSGIATPRPDPSDKRLPGIAHAFLGQVGITSTSTETSSESSPANTPSTNTHPERRAQLPQVPLPSTAVHALPTAPSSPKPPEEAQDQTLDEKMAGLKIDGKQQASLGLSQPSSRGILTPPSSNSSSFVSSSRDGNKIAQELAHASGSPAAGKPASGLRPIADGGSSRSRDFGASGPNPLDAVVSRSSVLAPHISNPVAEVVKRIPATPEGHSPQPSQSMVPVSPVHEDELTESVAPSPRHKSTPPYTPRALSTNGQDATHGSHTPTLHYPAGDAATLANKLNAALGQSSNSQSPNSQSYISGAPKGKLSVRISEARGIKPANNPYVLCVFEWNEYISGGPQNNENAIGPEPMSRQGSAMGGVPIMRTGSDFGRAMAIPMKSRQSSTTSLTEKNKPNLSKEVTDPKWEHEAVFDVVGGRPDVDVYVYDRSATGEESFLGHVKLAPNIEKDGSHLEGWFKLQPRDRRESVSGEIFLNAQFSKTEKRHYGPNDFHLLKLIGKGTFGQVYQVRKKDTGRIYAMKVLSKKVIVQKKEVAHTVGERNILVRTAMADSPFIVGLKFSFQTPTDLYLVTDFMSGGELFYHLQKEGRFNETRAKFYIAELILALQHLHRYNIVYRDLKPENILLDANGHIALCDFGLSKANLNKDDTTNTFCGTTEYLAPEVLLDEAGYTTMVDFWSLGVLVFEMCCGWSPFYAEDTQQMYKNIAFGKVRFPRDALSTEGRNFVKGLLNRNPKHRLGAKNDAEELKQHPFFADVDWIALGKKEVVPPFKPKLKSVGDTSNFDPEFTNAMLNSESLNARAQAIAGGQAIDQTPLSPGMQANFKGFTFVDESQMEEHFKDHPESDDRMDEDKKHGEDAGWGERSYDSTDGREHRMSGVVKTTTEDGMFSGHFDD